MVTLKHALQGASLKCDFLFRVSMESFYLKTGSMGGYPNIPIMLQLLKSFLEILFGWELSGLIVQAFE